MRYKIVFAYDGSLFNGFQIQDGGRTVQMEIEKALHKVTKEQVTIHASGRTDTGVHAKGQVAHFDVDFDISAIDMKNALNSTLPDDIYIRLCNRVSTEFHSRYGAKSKEYEYLINVGEYNPLLRNYVLQYCRELDVTKMQEAVKYLVGEHDFSSFVTGLGETDKDAFRTIYKAQVNIKGSRISIVLHGSGFLRYMVRGIVGTLIDVGRGKLNPEDMVSILEKKDRTAAGPNADACGLYLSNVYYN
ncbi:MAG: tRNA pseudouridine(38-40) synthase TruA [Bacilli bacterium]